MVTAIKKGLVMSANNIAIDYNFRANGFTDNAELRSHIGRLADAHASLFADIDVSLLIADKEAVNILTSACGALSTIFERQRKSDKPIYFAAGEEHTHPAHDLHHMLVAKGIMAEGYDLSVGLELRKKTIECRLLNHIKDRLGDGFDRDIASKYIDEHGLGLNALFFNPIKNSPYSVKILNHFLLQSRDSNNVLVKLTDAPRIIYGRCKEVNYLDLNDEFVKSLSEGANEIHTNHMDGMRIRNVHMVNELAGADKNTITMQVTGIFHIDYVGEPELLNNETLLAFASNAGFDPIGHVIKCKGYTPNAEKHSDLRFTHQDKLLISPSFSKEWFNWASPPSLQEIINEGREIEYLDVKMHALGMGSVIEAGFANICMKYIDNMDKHIDNIIRQSREQKLCSEFSCG